MDELRLRFQEAAARFHALAERLSLGQLLDPEECQEVSRMLQDLKDRQDALLRRLEEAGQNPDVPDTLDGLEEALRDLTRDGERRSVVRSFLALRTTEEFEDELAAARHRVTGLSRDALRRLDASGKLDAYRAVVAIVRGEGVTEERNRLVRKYFGYAIAYALLGGYITLPDDGLDEEPSVSVDTDPAEDSSAPWERNPSFQQADTASWPETAGSPGHTGLPVPETAPDGDDLPAAEAEPAWPGEKSPAVPDSLLDTLAKAEEALRLAMDPVPGREAPPSEEDDVIPIGGIFGREDSFRSGKAAGLSSLEVPDLLPVDEEPPEPWEESVPLQDRNTPVIPDDPWESMGREPEEELSTMEPIPASDDLPPEEAAPAEETPEDGDSSWSEDDTAPFPEDEAEPAAPWTEALPLQRGNLPVISEDLWDSLGKGMEEALSTMEPVPAPDDLPPEGATVLPAEETQAGEQALAGEATVSPSAEKADAATAIPDDLWDSLKKGMEEALSTMEPVPAPEDLPPEGATVLSAEETQDEEQAPAGEATVSPSAEKATDAPVIPDALRDAIRDSLSQVVEEQLSTMKPSPIPKDLPPEGATVLPDGESPVQEDSARIGDADASSAETAPDADNHSTDARNPAKPGEEFAPLQGKSAPTIPDALWDSLKKGMEETLSTMEPVPAPKELPPEGATVLTAEETPDDGDSSQPENDAAPAETTSEETAVLPAGESTVQEDSARTGDAKAGSAETTPESDDLSPDEPEPDLDLDELDDFFYCLVKTTPRETLVRGMQQFLQNRLATMDVPPDKDGTIIIQARKKSEQQDPSQAEEAAGLSDSGNPEPDSSGTPSEADAANAPSPAADTGRRNESASRQKGKRNRKAKGAPETKEPAVTPAGRIATPASTVSSTVPISTKEIGGKAYLKKLARLHPVAPRFLAALTHLGAMDVPLFLRYNQLVNLSGEDASPDTLEADLRSALRSLTRNGCVAEYCLRDREPIYVLSPASHSNLRKNVVQNTLHLGQLGEDSLSGTNVMDTDALLDRMATASACLDYLACQRVRLSHERTVHLYHQCAQLFRREKEYFRVGLDVVGETGAGEVEPAVVRTNPAEIGDEEYLVLLRTPITPDINPGDRLAVAVTEKGYFIWQPKTERWINETAVYDDIRDNVLASIRDRGDPEALAQFLRVIGQEPEPAPATNTPAAPESGLEEESPQEAATPEPPAPETSAPPEPAPAEPATRPAAPEKAPRNPARKPEPAETPAPREREPKIPRDAKTYARDLLQKPDPLPPVPLLGLAVRLLAEERFPEAVALAETLAMAPDAPPLCETFFQTLSQCLRVPGSHYTFASEIINAQQAALPEEPADLRAVQQTMVLCNQLWAMAFPSVPYDHPLYNNASMALHGDEPSAVSHLLSLLGGDLKELSFQTDGLGFSQSFLASLSSREKQEARLKRVQVRAGQLRTSPPVSNIGLKGLDACLRKLTGATSAIGRALGIVEAGRTDQRDQVRRLLKQELGEGDPRDDEVLDACVARAWKEVRDQEPSIRPKFLINISPAHRVCHNSLSERVNLLLRWLDLTEPGASAAATSPAALRVLTQIREALVSLVLLDIPVGDPMQAARVALLRNTAASVITVLDGDDLDEERFQMPLSLTPELLLGPDGSQVIVPELYQMPGMEPWTFLVRAVAAGPEQPQEILRDIENWETPRWYRNYGTEARLKQAAGMELPDRAVALRRAENAAREAEENFRSETRLKRAYGRIQESRMETAFRVLDLVRPVCFRAGDFATFGIFLERMRELLDRDTERQLTVFARKLQARERDGAFAGNPLLEAARHALESRNFLQVEAFLNQMESGVTGLPATDLALEDQEDYLRDFQDKENDLYAICQVPSHRSDTPSRWGPDALNRMEETFGRWSSANERRKGTLWIRNWLSSKGSPDNPGHIRDLLIGLGIQVNSVQRYTTTNARPYASYEVFQVHATPTSSNLKDYPHPIYRFGTELTDPLYVVCLYGCKGESTLIGVMTTDLQLNGSTLVLMDGVLTAVGRHTVAARFKANTSGQSPFLLIDRVLLLYLATLDEGSRMKALLRCTLPYTFELLYGSGSGAVPEEMFIGRISEMAQLCSPSGPVLVYGGRQLGKTALLNRASKILHDPGHRKYSFCVDIKDEDVSCLLDQVNRRLKKLSLLKEPAGSLEQLCRALETAWEEKRLRQLTIFVDEADQLFERFRETNYSDFRFFTHLHTATRNHARFVFAGTHNVAATDAAEKGNSSLLHLGPALCIEPLSPVDAVRLIRVPMSYLGFAIGDRQIELILHNTNSYPGLIHMFCSTLVQSVCSEYSTYYSTIAPKQNPPYQISDEQMRAVFKEKDIRKEIGIRVMSTIKLNRRYRLVSSLLAHMIYEDQENERERLYGYSARDLLAYNRAELQIPALLEMSETDLRALLDEMERMGILWKNRETGQYRFRQQDFLRYMGSAETVLETLLGEFDEPLL